MNKKKIIINEEKCVGCGLCANACKQNAIEMVDGKAKVVREDYCDGIGNCLPVCPVGAISFEGEDTKEKPLACGCPGTSAKTIIKHTATVQTGETATSQLNQWPVQIKLVSPMAPYFKNADLLVAADCTAFAYGNFHNDFIKNKITLIGCPKLDNEDYSEALTAILQNNDIKSVTVLRMEVPCCKGIADAVKSALIKSGKMIPWQIVTISTSGNIIQ